MSGSAESWDGERVRGWLQSRIEAARLDQAAADKRGYGAQDEYDMAAAEEWVCRALMVGPSTNERAALIGRIETLLGQDDYRATGIYDDRRFERYVRANLRKLKKMAKANDGFANLLRYQ